jgi:hypothetical protein
MVETLQPTALGLIILWPSLATFIVALRVYTRVSMKQFFLGEKFLATSPLEDSSNNRIHR